PSGHTVQGRVPSEHDSGGDPMTDLLDPPPATDSPEPPAVADVAAAAPDTGAVAVDTRAVGVRAALGGGAAMVVGLVVDAAEHLLDPALAEREGLFSLGNVGHALVLGGAGLVVAGLALAAAGPSLYGARSGPVPPARRAAQLAAPLALLALLAATAVWGSRSGLA